MIEAVKGYFPNGSLPGDVVVGSGGVKQAFFDRENPNTLVVLLEDNIAQYTGFVYVVMKSYKKEEK